MIVSSARTRAWLTAGVVMVIVFSGVEAVIALSMVGIDRILLGVEDIPPVASAASISWSRCSNKAFFFLSAFKSVFCCLKFIAYFFVATERADVAPVLPVMFVDSGIRQKDRERRGRVRQVVLDFTQRE